MREGGGHKYDSHVGGGAWAALASLIRLVKSR